MSTAMTPAPKQTTAVTPFDRIKKTFASKDFAHAVDAALPRHLKSDFMIRVVLTAVMKTPKLAQCTPESMINCVLQLAQYGLPPDGRLAHLIPRDVKNKKKEVIRTECTLNIDYKGLVDLVMRTGNVSLIHADVVCENDEFEYDAGVVTKHKPNFRMDRGEAFAAYAKVEFKDGTKKFEVMRASEIYDIRAKSEGWRSFKDGYASQSPWNPAEPTIEREMWKKTVFRRLTKWIPLSSEIRGIVEDQRHDEFPVDRIIDDNGPDDHINALVQKQLQDAAEEDPHPEPEQNGEQSQVTSPTAGEESQESPPEKTLTDADRAVLISAAIKAACENERLMHLEGETSLIESDEIRIRLYDEIKARRVIVTGFTGNPNKGKLV